MAWSAFVCTWGHGHIAMIEPRTNRSWRNLIYIWHNHNNIFFNRYVYHHPTWASNEDCDKSFQHAMAPVHPHSTWNTSNLFCKKCIYIYICIIYVYITLRIPPSLSQNKWLQPPEGGGGGGFTDNFCPMSLRENPSKPQAARPRCSNFSGLIRPNARCSRSKMLWRFSSETFFPSITKQYDNEHTKAGSKP